MKNVTKFGVIAGLMITVFGGCGVKYMENGFGGGCGHHTTSLNTKIHQQNQGHSKIDQSQVQNAFSVETAMSNAITQNQDVKNTQELTMLQKVKLVNKMRKLAKNGLNSDKINLSNQSSNIHFSQKQSELKNVLNSKKSGIDTSTEGLVKLILLILLAILIIGLLHMLLGSWLVNLLILILLIYLILVYLI